MITQMMSTQGTTESAQLDGRAVVAPAKAAPVPVDDGSTRGGYVLAEASVGDGTPEVILIATGGEVSVALRAREILEREGTPTRVVSMLCVRWFEAQDADYREAVLPRAVRVRVSVEAGAALGWYAMAGELIGLDHCGLSAPHRTLYEQFGFTPERVAAHARSRLARARERG